MPTSLFASFPSEIAAQVLYFIHQGKTEKGLRCYIDHAEESNSHDFELLQQAACALLEEGSFSSDAEVQLMSLFGAGVSLNTALLPVLERGARSKEPKLQLIALKFLSQMQDDEADLCLYEALSSPYLLLRLEAAYILAQKKDARVIEHIQALLVKVPPEVLPLFPQIIAQIESPAATTLLRQLLSDTDIEVRCAAILSVAEKEIDDLLPALHSLASNPDPCIQESCALAFTLLKDEKALPYFRKWMHLKQGMVRLAALKGLIAFADEEAEKLLEEEAKQKNPFAIGLLEDNSSSKEILKKLLADSDPSIRLNAALRLLEFKDKEVVPALKEILIRDARDLGFLRYTSPGQGMTAWRVIPHAAQKAKHYPGLKAQTFHLREKVLINALELPEEQFLEIARFIFQHHQTDLLPLLVDLLGNQKTDAAIALLKEQQQKAGAPLSRNYCNLALYRLQQAGLYEENLLRWIKEVQTNTLIQFREEEESVESSNSFTLTPEETSELLIESFEAIASSRNQKGIETLVRTIAYGNPKNRYALAGLLIRALE